MDKKFMKLALRHAQYSFREDEVPIGAIVVDSEGQLLSTSRNRVESTFDATAHAEIEALRRAAQVKQTWRLNGCTLYTTVEPCHMCLAAMQAFRIDRLVYGARGKTLGSCGSWIDLVNGNVTHPFHTIASVTGGVLEEESTLLMKRFFQLKRQERRDKASPAEERYNIA